MSEQTSPTTQNLPESARTPQPSATTMMQYDNNKKSVGVAYLLWFFLGFLGVHRFYLGKVGTGVVILILTILGWALSLVGVGIVLLGVVGIWWIVDAFLIPGIARSKNNELIAQLSS
jgi:TM2 domain-containing membrane protein YozV